MVRRPLFGVTRFRGRRLLLPTLLLAAVPAFAERVTVHLDFSDSVRAALARGDIEGVYVSVAGHVVLTKGTTVIVDDVPPGKASVRALLNTGRGNYVIARQLGASRYRPMKKGDSSRRCRTPARTI